MTSRSLIALLLVSLWLTWAVWPPSRMVLDQNCQATGIRARVSAVLFGERFWDAQRAAAVEERDRLLAEPSRRERAAEEPKDSTSIDARMEHLAASGENAEAAEHRRVVRLVWVATCLTAAEDHLKH